MPGSCARPPQSLQPCRGSRARPRPRAAARTVVPSRSLSCLRRRTRSSRSSAGFSPAVLRCSRTRCTCSPTTSRWRSRSSRPGSQGGPRRRRARTGTSARRCSPRSRTASRSSRSRSGSSSRPSGDSRTRRTCSAAGCSPSRSWVSPSTSAPAAILYRARDGGFNVEAAFRHVLADLAGSFGVVAAAIVILTTGWLEADPLVSIAIALLVLASSWTILRDSTTILLEAAPSGIDTRAVGERLARAPGVVEVHDLHIWTITTGFPALSAHVLVGRGEDCHARRRELEMLLRDEFGDRAHDPPGRPRGRSRRARRARRFELLAARYDLRQRALPRRGARRAGGGRAPRSPARARTSRPRCGRGPAGRARGTPRRRAASGSRPSGSPALPRGARTGTTGCRSCGSRRTPRSALADVAERGRDELAHRREDDHRVELLGRACERVAGPDRTERAGERLRLLVARAGAREDAATLRGGDLADDVRGGAEAVEPERLDVLAREPQRAVPDRARRRGAAPPARRGSRAGSAKQ